MMAYWTKCRNSFIVSYLDPSPHFYNILVSCQQPSTDNLLFNSLNDIESSDFLPRIVISS